MDETQPPTLDEFLAAPLAEVARVAPATLVYAAGGTRRRAALVGLPPQSQEYARWAREQLLAVQTRIFDHGIRHLITPALIDTGFSEGSGYVQRALEWVRWGVAGPEALADYAQRGWRVRLLGGEAVPDFQEIADRLRAGTPAHSGPTLWWVLVPNGDAPWRALLAAAQAAQARTRAEAIRALYGEDIPPAGLLLAFGKPFISASLVPPLLVGDMQCYWTQRAGFELTDQELRTILYDYAFLRTTWRADKTDRPAQALTQRAAWERGPILGLGTRLGPYWYPAPYPDVPAAPDSE